MIAAGFDPDFLRWGCTIKDFKAYLLSVMKDRMEKQREFTMAMSLAVASLFDPKVGKDASTAVSKAISAIENQQEGLYGLQEFARTGERPARSSKEERRARENQKDESGLTQKEIKTWKDAGQIDVLMAKMTGRPTGAAWSNINDGTLQMDGDALSGRVKAQTGAQIVSKLEQMYNRTNPQRVGAGPRRKR